MPSHGPIKPRRVALLVETLIAPRRQMLAGVARYMNEHEPWSIYLKPYGVEKSLPDWLRRWNGDGIIAAIAELATDLVKQFGIPIVDVAGWHKDQGVPLVHANDDAIGRLGAEHLLGRGFRNFGFVEYPQFWATGRRAGFERVVRSEGRDCAVYTMVYPQAGHGGPELWERQQQALVEWIGALPKPLGVMTSNDPLGQQFLEACRRAKVVVPEQVAVIGADNDETICRLCYPPLSSVIINDEQRGYQAAALLDQLMSGGPPPTAPVYVEPAGVVTRASSDILAIDDPTIAAALRFVRDHACEGIGVSHVVRAVPLSRTMLERRFRKAVGHSINDEMVRVRLNRAIEMLSSTNLELKVIAYKAGFGSPSYMGAVFRERLGRTPGSYRAALHRSSKRQ
jgi:LacI family transcriptional regulator